MRWWQSAGLLASWVVHDAEEWVTAPAWARSRGADQSTPDWVRRLPIVAAGTSDRHMHVAITAMGAIVAGATAEGCRSGGRSPFYRAAVLSYGLHGLGHVGASVAVRGYTPGVVTTPLLVLPYAVWSFRRGVREHGSIQPATAATAVALLPAALGLAHGIAHIVAVRSQ